MRLKVYEFRKKEENGFQGDVYEEKKMKMGGHMIKKVMVSVLIIALAVSAGGIARTEAKNSNKLNRKINNVGTVDTMEKCVEAYNNCSNHGSCVEKKTPNNKTRYVCNCNTSSKGNGADSRTKWTGVDCSLRDISIPFNIILWLTLALIGIIVTVIMMFFDLGSSDTSLSQSMSYIKPKID